MLDAEDEKNSEGIATLIMRLHLHTQFRPLYYQNHPSSMQTLIQQSWPCWTLFNQRMMMLMKMQPMTRFFLIENMPKTDQLFQCHVNRMSLLWNGLTTNH